VSLPNGEQDPWEQRTGILNIPTRLIRWFSTIFTAAWLILTAVTSYNSASAHVGASWDSLVVGIVNAGAPNIGFALPTAYILTEVIDMVLGAWYRQRTRARAREEGLEEGRKEGRKEGHQQGMREQQERWLQWLERQRVAESNGAPFSEPPPDLDGEHPAQE